MPTRLATLLTLAALGMAPVSIARAATPSLLLELSPRMSHGAGTVEAGACDPYELQGRKGQKLTVQVTSQEGTAYFQIYQPGWKHPAGHDLGFTGKTLAGAGQGQFAKTWSGTLPATGTYVVAVGSSSGEPFYHVSVTFK